MCMLGASTEPIRICTLLGLRGLIRLNKWPHLKRFYLSLRIVGGIWHGLGTDIHCLLGSAPVRLSEHLISRE